MHLNDSALRDSAPRAARVSALDLLKDVREARDRLDHPGDSEALHDFRVAVRRLRSWLRAFRDIMRDTLEPKQERRLRRIAQATGDSRDLEVHIEWVEGSRRSLRGPARYGATWLLGRLGDEKAMRDREFREVLDDEFDRTVRQIDKGMARYVASVAKPEPRFARVVAGVIRHHAADLSSALARVSTLGDRTEAHDARIRAKRLRYLLEPLEHVLAEVPPLVEALTSLQDQLGELHDAQIFGSQLAELTADLLANRTSESSAAKGAQAGGRSRSNGHDDAVPGLVAMSRRLNRTEKTTFASVKTSWLGDQAAPLLLRVASVAASLDEIAKQGREIEHKYLLRRIPADMPLASTVEIQQGYLPGDRLVERVRSVTSEDDSHYYRTVKVGVGLDRTEIEEETDKSVFDALWPLTRRMRIRKLRHRVKDDSHLWEIDEFLDRELVLAEVEVDDPDASPPLPGWLDGVVEREVTNDDEYANRALAC
ncbi:MAG: CHAD domain-containing protein [Gemmatimonadaceae bacterium]